MSLRSGIVLLASLSVLAALMGCGGSSSTPNNTITGTTSTNSQLSGTYAFSISGLDVNGAFFAITGTFAADGNGGITGGAVDYNDASGVPAPNLAVTGGSYAVGSDGRGTATLKITSLGNLGVDFVLSSTSHGLITEFDKNGSGSGTFDLQGSASQSSIANNPYAFSVAGVDGNGATSQAGAFTLDDNGNITAGIQDFTDVANVAAGQPLTGTVTLASTPGTATFNSPLGAQIFDVYVVDQTHLKLIENDSLAVLAGDVFTQQNTSTPSGAAVFTIGGSTGGGSTPFAAGGLLTFNSDGSISGGSEDINDGSLLSQVFSGTYTALSGGRSVLFLSGFSPATQVAIYPSSGGLLMVEADVAGNVASGTALAQTATSFSTTGGYAFNLSAFNLGGGVEVDDIAAFTATSSNITGTIDENDEGSTLSPGQAFSGTYAATSGGRGTMVLQGGSFNADYYVASGSSVLLIETDAGQVGTGQFLGQTAVGDSASAILHAAMARPLTLHPAKSLKKKMTSN